MILYLLRYILMMAASGLAIQSIVIKRGLIIAIMLIIGLRRISMIIEVMYKEAVRRLIRVLDIAIDRAREEDRDEDYDKLVDIRFYIDEIHEYMLEVLRK